MSLAPFEVRCPACEAEYPVDPERIPPDGVHAVCAACMRTFPVEAPPADSFDAELDLEREPAIEQDLGVPDFEPEPETGALPELAEPEVRSEPEIRSEPEVDAAPEIRSEPPVDVEPGVEAETPLDVEPEMEAEPPVDVEPEVEAEADSAVESDPPIDVEPEVESEFPLDVEPEVEAEHRVDLQPDPPAAAPGPDVEGPPDSTGAVEDLRDIVGDIDEPEEPGQSAGSAALSRGAARFGRRDPHERAQRLARVLVSDIIAYYPKKHAEAVERGTVKEEFENEVRKSHKEYVDQVGEEIADSTPYFREALNEVLARGRQIY